MKITDKSARNIAIVVTLAAFFLMFWFLVWPGSVWGGTHSQKIPLMYGVVEPDSVLVRVNEVGSGTQVGDDTIITAFPDTLVYTIDSAKVYESQVFEAWYGAGDYERPVTWVIPLRLIAATVDSTDVARFVWNTPQSSHTTAGTFGKYLDTEVSGVGGGSDTLIYYAADTLNDNHVGGVQVTCYGIGGSQVGAKQVTTASGYNLWALNTSDSLIFIVYGPHLYNWELDTVLFTGQSSDSAMGWKTADPAAVGSPVYVSAYIDIGTGIVDTLGQMIPRENMLLRLNLVGGLTFNDGSWIIVPRQQEERPNASGRATFLIPTNDALTPSDSYYELSFVARDGASMTRGIIKKFVVDSLTDPINIMNATEVW